MGSRTSWLTCAATSGDSPRASFRPRHPPATALRTIASPRWGLLRPAADRGRAATRTGRRRLRADHQHVNSDPMLPRSVFGIERVHAGSTRMIAAAPAASAVRISVPRLPGSCSRSSTTAGSRPDGSRWASDASGMWKDGDDALRFLALRQRCHHGRRHRKQLTAGPSEALRSAQLGSGELLRAVEHLVGRLARRGPYARAASPGPGRARRPGGACAAQLPHLDNTFVAGAGDRGRLLLCDPCFGAEISPGGHS